MPVPADKQTDGQAGRKTGRQAGSPLSEAETPGAQWLPWIHSWSLFTAVCVCLLYACVLSFVLKALHLVPRLEMMCFTFCNQILFRNI